MLIIRQTSGSIDEFWRNYWARVPRDPDRIRDASIYPLFPIDQYVRPQMRVLEAGCGMGRVFKHYFHQGVDIVGLEYDAACLAKLRRENPGFPLLCADAKALPLTSETMDLVMAFGLISSLEHDHRHALGELRRVLRGGGLFCASVACDTPLRRLQNLLAHTAAGMAKLWRRSKSDLHFFARAWRPDEWKAELEAAGLRVIRIEPTHSRVVLWQYLPFLRATSAATLDLGEARDGDIGYRLTPLGERVFQWTRRNLPWLIAVGVVAVAEKPATGAEP